MQNDVLGLGTLFSHAVGAPLGHAHAVPVAAAGEGDLAVRDGDLTDLGGLELGWVERDAKRRAADVLSVDLEGDRAAGFALLTDLNGFDRSGLCARGFGGRAHFFGGEGCRPVLHGVGRAVGIIGFHRLGVGRFLTLIVQRLGGQFCLPARVGVEPGVGERAVRAEHLAPGFVHRLDDAVVDLGLVIGLGFFDVG